MVLTVMVRKVRVCIAFARLKATNASAFPTLVRQQGLIARTIMDTTVMAFGLTGSSIGAKTNQVFIGTLIQNE